MKTALVLGGAGFIGMALTRRLKEEGCWVRAVDIRNSPFEASVADDFMRHDLRTELPLDLARADKSHFDEVYQLACDVGGSGYILTGENDAKVMSNNVRINVNVAEAFERYGCGKLLYSSSACVYNDRLSDERGRYGSALRELDAVEPPSSGYGWEKLFCEQLYGAYERNNSLNVRITRFSTIYGPGSAFDNGRENAVAAICRKVLDAPNGGEVEVWGDGAQQRPLVYIDDLLDAMTRLVRHPSFVGPLNIATAELTSCDEIARQAIALSNKRLTIKHVPGPIGKQVLLMSTDRAERHLGWKATTPFFVGLERTFKWIAERKALKAA